MIRYVAILEKEPTSLWGIWFPDLAGCVSAAGSAELTIEQASEALQLWIDDARDSGAVLPPARTIDELRLDPDVAAAFANGDAAVLVTLPSVRDDVAFDQGAITAIDAAAAARGVTRLDFVREAVLAKLAS